ncbi:NAD(P)-dependent dehydrogenase (short-subunit alcohol dehydrogenase family) [Catalinimonas alkaloidigena]|uniref:SDR family NAD(P)-dependent oxidoreductase n=1 Tax=Catalinimonas alkaloidigena TaxID=1075417 RepID=UPI0024075BCF|nr:SDR family oxidoreductase [Catalinimonas alkaloidigena]MDF9799509.1 NAD(P)-dependent dehydrogenase (short-subunit alcohol dehydrogenase family) [Catalinimonas alkaloidigena]
MDLQLKNKKTLVTGSTAGIGFAIAQLLAAEGAEVIINGRKKEDVEEVVSTIRKDTSNDKVKGIAADFSKADEVKNLIAQLPELDILINNVGIFNEVDFEETSDEEWFEIFEVNVMSGVRLARYYFPQMLKKNEGRIIFISSESALNIPTEMIHYGMTKTAQLSVSRGLARLSKGTNVTVNAVLPGPTLSRANLAGLEEEAEKAGKSLDEVKTAFFEERRPTSLIQRFADIEEVASMVAYVASPLSSATNGAALRVDGGVVNAIF